MRIERQLWIQSCLAAIATLTAAGCAHALPGQGVETVVRYATEPSTGSMVVAAVVVLATIRRKRHRTR